MPPPQGLPPGLTPQMLEAWQGDNPGSTPEQGIKEFILHQSKTQARPVSDIFQQWVTQSQQPMGNPIQQSWQKVASPVTQGLGTVVGDTAARMVIPQDPTSAALMAASGSLKGAGTGLRGILGRTGTMGALGAAGETAEGGDASTGLMKGAVSQGLGEVIPGAVNLGRKVWDATKGTFATTGNLINWSDQYAQRVARGAVQEFNEFLRAMPGAKSYADALFNLTQKAPGGTRRLGEEYLGNTIQQSENVLKRVLGGDAAEINAPTLWKNLTSEAERQQYGQVHTGALPTPGTPGRTVQSPILGPNGQPVTSRVAGTPGQPGVPGTVQDVVPPMTVKEAFDGIKELTSRAIAAGKGYDAHALWDAVNQAKQEVLSTVPPKLAQQYLTDLSQYGKGLAFLNALEEGFKSKLTSPSKTIFDINGMLENLQAKGYSNFFPNFNAEVLKGAEAGSRETIRGGFKARAYKMGESMTMNVPGHRAQPIGAPPRRQPHSPSNLITGLSLQGINEMTSNAANTVSGYDVP